MRGGEIHVDGSLSSQFITGLLMTLPLSPNDTVLHVENLKSRPYVDMTIDLAEMCIRDRSQICTCGVPRR